jgi:hypothetical protein
VNTVRCVLLLTSALAASTSYAQVVGVQQISAPCVPYKIALQVLTENGERLQTMAVTADETSVMELYVDESYDGWSLIVHKAEPNVACVVMSGRGIVDTWMIEEKGL